MVSKRNDQCCELEDRILRNDKEYQSLLRRKEQAYKDWRKVKKEEENKVSKVRRLYLAKGLTPTVIKLIDGLVEELNKE